MANTNLQHDAESAALATDGVSRVQSLFIQHVPQLRGFVHAILPGFDHVDDVIQETFLTVTRKSGDFEVGTNFLAWACTIARYKAAEMARRDPRKTQFLSDEVLDALCARQTPATPKLAERKETQLNALADCLERLAPQARRIINLRYNQGRRSLEIAELLGSTTKSVHESLSRSRSLLRGCLDRKLNEAGA